MKISKYPLHIKEKQLRNASKNIKVYWRLYENDADTHVKNNTQNTSLHAKNNEHHEKINTETNRHSTTNIQIRN